MGEIHFFLGTVPFNPWAVLATWLQVGAPQKKYKKNTGTWIGSCGGTWFGS
jgi:hypothetical protein